MQLNTRILTKLVPDYGQIGAGAAVLQFPSKRKRLVAVPEYAINQVVFTHTVCGDSLEDPSNPRESIYDGDTLICHHALTIEQIKDKICIVYIHTTGELVAKRVIIANDNQNIILRSANPNFIDREFEIDAIEIRGVVLDFQRGVCW